MNEVWEKLGSIRLYSSTRAAGGQNRALGCILKRADIAYSLPEQGEECVSPSCSSCWGQVRDKPEVVSVSKEV